MRVEILQHKIKWWYSESKLSELPESEEEHIKEMIEQGYSSGELCFYDVAKNKEIRGWWEIIKA